MTDSAALSENINFMLENDSSTEEIAAGFGVQHSSLTRRLRRLGLDDTADALSQKRVEEASDRLGRRIVSGRFAA